MQEKAAKGSALAVTRGLKRLEIWQYLIKTCNQNHFTLVRFPPILQSDPKDSASRTR